jgi:hypothetical protein
MYRRDLQSLGKHRLRELLRLALGRECFGMSRSSRETQSPLFRPFDRNEPVIGNHLISGHDGPMLKRACRKNGTKEQAAPLAQGHLNYPADHERQSLKLKSGQWRPLPLSPQITGLP